MDFKRENIFVLREDLYFYATVDGATRKDQYTQLSTVAKYFKFIPQTLGEQNWLFFEIDDHIAVTQYLLTQSTPFSEITGFTQKDVDHWLNNIPYDLVVRTPAAAASGTVKLAAYDPSKVTLSINGVKVFGFAEDVSIRTDDS